MRLLEILRSQLCQRTSQDSSASMDCMDRAQHPRDPRSRSEHGWPLPRFERPIRRRQRRFSEVLVDGPELALFRLWLLALMG